MLHAEINCYNKYQKAVINYYFLSGQREEHQVDDDAWPLCKFFFFENMHFWFSESDFIQKIRKETPRCFFANDDNLFELVNFVL